MTKALKRTLIVFAVSFATSIGFADPVSTYGGFTFSSDMNDSQVKILKEDIDYLYHLPVLTDSYGLQQMTEMKAVSGPDLHNWILNRLHIFISEAVNPNNLFSLTKQSYDYENMSILPKLKSAEGGANEIDDANSVIATNIGGSLYIIGKREKTLGMATVNGKTLPVLSPRVGIVQVPDSFFPSDNQKPAKLIDRLLRITTIFHEARHSDGNGTSLGFLHEVCPVGHMLEGKLACDKMENGSYGVEARFQRVLSRNCAKCSNEDLEVLRLMSLQNFGRLILPPQANARAAKVREEMDANRHILQICKTIVGEQDKCSADFIKETKQKYVDTRAQLDYLLRAGNSSKPLRPMVNARPEGFFQEMTIEESGLYMNHQL